VHDINHTLAAAGVPEAVTSEHDEFVVSAVSLNDLEVGLSGHGLVFLWNISSLEEQVTNSSRDSEVSLHAAIIDE